MTLPPDFAVFILTHGRPDNVKTVKTLKNAGYTGPIYFVVDDEDKTIDQYKANFGDRVCVFNKREIADQTDEGDNFDDRRTITHARNASYDIAMRLGVRYFVQLDDDYVKFDFRTNESENYAKDNFKIRKTLNDVFASLLRFYTLIDAACIAIAQGGDFIGGKDCGAAVDATLKRKCMNSFFCSTERRVWFVGRMNEDVNTYTSLGARGKLFFTIPLVSLTQTATQSNPGGISEAYKAYGTYVKSFYTVMFAPSCTKVSMMNSRNKRIHHAIEWRNAVPVILSEEHASERLCRSKIRG